jgi:hypothetical protein
MCLTKVLICFHSNFLVGIGGFNEGKRRDFNPNFRIAACGQFKKEHYICFHYIN